MSFLPDIAELRALPEVFARHVYWSFAPLQKLYGTLRAKRPPALKYLDLDRLGTALQAAGVADGCCVMVHSSTDGIGLRAGDKQIDNKLQVAAELLKFLKVIVGPTGTLFMPTHPWYRDDPGFMRDKTGLRLVYDPDRTPSKVGLLTELFRRAPGTVRSRHPLSSVAGAGPRAQEIIGNGPNPGDLPHGQNSSYKRFCDANGLVVAINVRIINALTIVHVAEELRDKDWPVGSFFYERSFDVVEGQVTNPQVVRERHPKWVRYISLRSLLRDLVREGFIVERSLDGVRIGFANAPMVVEYMLNRNASSTYPYFFLQRFKNAGK